MELNTTRVKIFQLLVPALLLTSMVLGQGDLSKVKIPFGHSEKINVVEITPDGKYIVTGSEDGTIIIWDARTAKELRTLFIKANVQDLEISPDAKQLVVASGSKLEGQFKYSIWDFRTGKLDKELPFYGNLGFAFTANENMLLVPGYSESKQKVSLFSLEKLFQTLKFTLYDIESNKAVKTFNNGQNLDNNSGTIRKPKSYILGLKDKQYFVAIEENILAQKNEGSILNIWNLQNDSKPEWSISCAEKVGHIAVLPGSDRFATTSNNKILIWKIGSSNPIDSFFAKAIGGVDHIQFTADGKRLFCYSATGEVSNGKNKRSAQSIVQIWNLENRTELSSFEMPLEINLRNINLAPDGRYFLYLNNTTAKAIDIRGENMFSLNGHVIETKRMFFSENNQYLAPYSDSAFELSKKMDILSKSIDDAVTKVDNPEFKKLMEKMFKNPIDSLSRDAKNGKDIYVYMPSFNLITGSGFMGKRLYNDLVIKGEKIPITSRTFSSDLKTFVLNNAGRPAGYEDFNVIAGERNLPGEGREIVNTGNKMLTMVEPGSKSKTIINRITHDTLNLIYLDSADWIIVTNKGYYKCSKNAAGLLHYVTNNDKIVSFEQLDIRYNRPDIVLQELGSNEKGLIEAYKKTYINRLERYKLDIKSLEQRVVLPEADFVDRDKIEYNQSGEIIQIHIKASSISSPLQRFNVWVNEVPVFKTNGISLSNGFNYSLDTSISVKLSAGRNKIETAVYNAAGFESYRYPLFVNFKPKTTSKPRTWFIGIGVNKYTDPAYNNLKYTISDIRALAAGLRNKLGDALMVDTMFNNNFTLDGLNRINKKLADIPINDRVIFFYSGHGVLGKDGKYYFPTSAMSKMDFTDPAIKAISYESLEAVLENTPARNKLFLIDACHSGVIDKLDETVLDSTTTSEIMDELFTYVGRGTGATVLTSCSGNSKAQESDELMHGFFTQGILNALREFNAVSVGNLKNYLLEKVPLISNQLQRPTVRSENRESDFKIW